MPQPILNAIKTGQPWMPKGQRDPTGCIRLQGVSHVPSEPHRFIVMKDDGANSDISVNSLIQLAQWNTMFIFDYITGNYDR